MTKPITPAKVLKQWLEIPGKQRTGRLAKKYAAMCGMRSMAEVEYAVFVSDEGFDYAYETEVFKYQINEQNYSPDFLIDGVRYEIKGKLTPAVKRKMIAIKRCHPDMILVMLFVRGQNKVAPKSNTTYMDWAFKNRFTAFNLDSPKEKDMLKKYLELNSGEEKWVRVHENINYLLSNRGNVYSFIGNKKLKPSNNGAGYFLFHLGEKVSIIPHRAVLEYFVGPCPKGYECNHIDGNKQNNYVSNLEWVSKSDNHKHAFKTGLNKPPPPMVGSKHPKAKLTESDVSFIKKLHGTYGVTVTDLAKVFGVTKTNISGILRGKIWKHVQ